MPLPCFCHHATSFQKFQTNAASTNHSTSRPDLHLRSSSLSSAPSSPSLFTTLYRGTCCRSHRLLHSPVQSSGTDSSSSIGCRPINPSGTPNQPGKHETSLHHRGIHQRYHQQQWAAISQSALSVGCGVAALSPSPVLVSQSAVSRQSSCCSLQSSSSLSLASTNDPSLTSAHTATSAAAACASHG